MPQNITDVATFTAPIVAPADGDPEGAASVLTPFQGLSNRTRYLYSLIGAANGLATLDSTARVAAANVRGGLISLQNVAYPSGSVSTNSTSFVDLPTGLTADVTLTGNNGDLVLMLAQVNLEGDGSNFGLMRLAVKDGPSTTSALQESQVEQFASSFQTFTMVGLYELSLVGTGGTAVAKVQMATSGGGGTASARGPLSFIVAQFRP